MSTRTNLLKCGKCEAGTVIVVIKLLKTQVNTQIYSCDKCNYRYGFKEINDLEIKEIFNP